MKKLILVFFISTILFGCEKSTPEPIEKYSGSKYVVTSKIYTTFTDGSCSIVKLKNSDTIFSIVVLNFDVESRELKVGDTIK
jgi:hypothetical protein